jgi:O-antigen/teichoic acid export membrane protein
LNRHLAQINRPGSRIRKLLRVLTGFVLGQAGLQAVSILIGLFLVRSLSINSYAQFSLALGFQATASILMDLGFASTIIPLVGERHADRALVGKYIRGGKSLRDRAFLILSPVVAVVFLVITHKQQWGWPIQLGLLASVLLALYSSSSASYYSVPLLLYRRLREFYLLQTGSNACRLLLYVILNAAGSLNSVAAAGISALNATLNGFLLKREGGKAIDWPENDDPAIRKEIIQYILPALPAILLGAFHGQIALFLISIFGSTVNIAQVAALGRLGQIFYLLMTFNVVIVEPYVARLPRARLLTTYFRLVAAALAGGTLLVLIAFSFPQIFLWVIGPRYAQLQGLIGWVVMTACINYVAGLIWIMNRSRKWLFWRGSIAEISLLAAVQIGYLLIFGVRSTRGAILFNFASSFCYVVAHLYVAILGFTQRARGEPLDPVRSQIATP